MGRHASVDETRSHPLVADALLRRAAPGATVTRRGEPNVVAPLTAGPVASAPGWPGDPAHAEGLGWPGEPGSEPVSDAPGLAGPAGDEGSRLVALDAAEQEVPVGPAADPAPRRAGWRRFLRGGHTSTTSAA